MGDLDREEASPWGGIHSHNARGSGSKQPISVDALAKPDERSSHAELFLYARGIARLCCGKRHLRLLVLHSKPLAPALGSRRRADFGRILSGEQGTRIGWNGCKYVNGSSQGFFPCRLFPPPRHWKT